MNISGSNTILGFGEESASEAINEISDDMLCNMYGISNITALNMDAAELNRRNEELEVRNKELELDAARLTVERDVQLDRFLELEAKYERLRDRSDVKNKIHQLLCEL
jgi:hypothetical protein